MSGLQSGPPGAGARRDETEVFVLSPEGDHCWVCARPSGVPFRDQWSGEWVDVIALPAIYGVGMLRHKYQFKGGWSVAVRTRKSVWRRERLIGLERHPTREAALARVQELVEEIARRGIRHLE